MFRRRSFLKSSSIIAGGLILPKLSFKSKKLNQKKLKIAVVGCGGRGTGAAVQALRADNNVELVTLADAFKDRLEASLNAIKDEFEGEMEIDIKEKNKFVGFDAYKKAIDKSDVVILASPPGFRPAHFEYAINKNKHVFMEKPVATDIDGIKRIIKTGKLAQSKKLNVVVGLQRHYQRNYRAIKKMIDRGRIGDIISGQVYWNSGGVWVKPREKDQTELEYQMRNWYYFNWLCGDHIVEQHIHNIDVANWFIGANPISAQGMGGREVRKGIDHGQIYDHHFVEYTYPDGQIIASQCRHQKGCMNRVEEVFQGTKGSVTINSANFALMKNKRKKTIYDHQGEDDINPYQQEHNDLFKAIRLGQYKINDTKQGADATLSAIIGRMATYSGQVITWDEAIKMDQNLVPDLYSFDDEAPVQPDENGMYPIPIPGVTKY